jgi:hypothetical protein
MTAEEVLTRAQALGVTVSVDGPDLVVRCEAGLPTDLVEELRQHKSELLFLLANDPDDDPVCCRGCAEVIPAGTTLCVECGSARSPLVRYAVELSALAAEKTLRGQALVALDRRRYPKLTLSGGHSIGPGLIAWAAVLRDAKAPTLRRIIALAERSQRRSDDDD